MPPSYCICLTQSLPSAMKDVSSSKTSNHTQTKHKPPIEDQSNLCCYRVPQGALEIMHADKIF